MRFLRLMGSVFCVLAICFMCILAASVFNPTLSEMMKKAGENAISVIKEFSEKAEVNAFSDDLG